MIKLSKAELRWITGLIREEKRALTLLRSSDTDQLTKELATLRINQYQEILNKLSNVISTDTKRIEITD